MDEIIMFTTSHPYIVGSASLAVTAALGTFLYKYHYFGSVSTSNSEALIPLDLKSAKNLFNVDYDAWSDEVLDENPKDESVKVKSVKKIEIDGIVTRVVESLLRNPVFREAFHNAELYDPNLLEDGTNPKLVTRNVISTYVGKYITYQIGLTTLFEKGSPDYNRIVSYLNSNDISNWCRTLCESKPGIEGFKEWIKLQNIHIANVVNTYQPNNAEYRIVVHVRNYEKFLNFVKENGIAMDLSHTSVKPIVNQLDYHVALYDALHKVLAETATKVPPEVLVKATDQGLWAKFSALTKSILGIFF